MPEYNFFDHHSSHESHSETELDIDGEQEFGEDEIPIDDNHVGPMNNFAPHTKKQIDYDSKNDAA